MTEAEQMAIYNMQVLGLKAEVVQHFFAMATMVVACVAMVVAIVALIHYIKVSRLEMVVLQGDDVMEEADTAYTTLNLAETDDVQKTVEEVFDAEAPVQTSDESAE